MQNKPEKDYTVERSMGKASLIVVILAVLTAVAFIIFTDNWGMPLFVIALITMASLSTFGSVRSGYIILTEKQKTVLREEGIEKLLADAKKGECPFFDVQTNSGPILTGFLRETAPLKYKIDDLLNDAIQVTIIKDRDVNCCRITLIQ